MDTPRHILIYHAKDGWRWRGVADNGKIVSESGEAFETLVYAKESARWYGPRGWFWPWEIKVDDWRDPPASKKGKK